MADNQQSPAATPPVMETELSIERPEDSMALAETQSAEISVSGVPQLTPPEEQLLIGAEEAISTWLTNKKIVRLWTNSANKNSWISIAGIGWRRLYHANESAVVCMTMLAAHARAHNRNVNVRIESDNLVHEIYVW